MDQLLQSTKYGGRKLDSQVMTRRVNWLNSIREWQQDFLGSLDAREFVDCVTDELFGKGVFVFTPFGEVMRLPKVSGIGDCIIIHTWFQIVSWIMTGITNFSEQLIAVVRYFPVSHLVCSSIISACLSCSTASFNKRHLCISLS